MRYLILIGVVVVGGLWGAAATRHMWAPKPTLPTPTPTPIPTPPAADAEKLARAKQLAGAQAPQEQQAEAIKLLQDIPKSAPEYKAAQQLLKKTTEELAESMAVETLVGPRPMTGFGGKVLCVDRYLAATLNDYDSSEYLEWSSLSVVRIKKEPYWAVTLKLRAKNAFGAKLLKAPTFLIRRNQVVKVEGL